MGAGFFNILLGVGINKSKINPRPHLLCSGNCSTIDIHKQSLFGEHMSHEEVIQKEGDYFMVRVPGAAHVSEKASEEFMYWLITAPIGDVRTHKTCFPSGAIYQSFTNTPVHGDEVTLMAGSAECVHVAVGFVDLSTAAAARSSASPGLHLRWVGYDLSVHAAAKAAIVAQMLADGAEVDEILQVWILCWCLYLRMRASPPQFSGLTPA